MRRLYVDLAQLASAFDNSSYELSFYLDLKTGKVEMVTEDMRSELEALDEILTNKEEETTSAEELVPAGSHGLPDWQQDARAVARAVEEGSSTRYTAIPKVEGHEAYRDMEDFIATVANLRLQERLYRAIGGHGAFRYFENVLLDYPKERERWFAYRDERIRERVLEWLEAEEIEPIE